MCLCDSYLVDQRQRVSVVSRTEQNGTSVGWFGVVFLLLLLSMVAAAALPGWEGVIMNNAKSAHSQHETVYGHVT